MCETMRQEARPGWAVLWAALVCTAPSLVDGSYWIFMVVPYLIRTIQMDTIGGLACSRRSFDSSYSARSIGCSYQRDQCVQLELYGVHAWSSVAQSSCLRSLLGGSSLTRCPSRSCNEI